MSDAEKIVAALNREKLRKNVSFYQLGRDAGLSPIAVTRILDGTYVNPRVVNLVKIANALGKRLVVSP